MSCCLEIGAGGVADGDCARAAAKTASGHNCHFHTADGDDVASRGWCNVTADANVLLSDPAGVADADSTAAASKLPVLAAATSTAPPVPTSLVSGGVTLLPPPCPLLLFCLPSQFFVSFLLPRLYVI